MATLSQSLANLYSTAAIFLSTLFLELAIFIYNTAKTSVRRESGPSDRFLEIIGQNSTECEYKAELGLEPRECRVCLSLFEEGDGVRNLRCNHAFHRDCIDTWLDREYATCPLCRVAVLSPEMVVECRNRGYDRGGEDGDEEVMVLYAFHGNFMRNFF